MKDRLTETIYDGEHYMIPSDEMKSWFYYMKDLSIFQLDCGHTQIAFFDHFNKYKI